MATWKTLPVAFVVLAALLMVSPLGTTARNGDRLDTGKSQNELQRVLVLDGSNVHDVGDLRVHVTNWGLFGSLPGGGFPFSDAPSAEWPSGSGIEHLYASGLWVGAIKNGVPAVSTAAYQFEFRPTPDPIDIIYQTQEGAPGGNRYPSPDVDDDGDGMVDEDWLNGHDDDSDAMIDEDFAAISNQMFSCWYTDNQPEAIQIYPDHNPLDIMVRQESYQWNEPGFDDFVGIEFTITNIGSTVLEDIYVGFFADPDIGHRTTPNYWADDAAGSLAIPLFCTMYGGVSLDFAYAYDADGDGGQVTSYFGFGFLGHPTDPTGELAPPRVGLTTYAAFSGNQSYEEGGDPTNDFERYEIMSSQTRERDSTVPRDHRQLIATGPFAELVPGQTIKVQLALVAGDGLTGLRNNMAAAQLTYDGAWFNLDGNPMTGIAGRETPLVGPWEGVVVDSCQGTPPITIPPGEVVWINTDCADEILTKLGCGYSDADSIRYLTGVGGREFQVHWWPPPQDPVPVLISGFDAIAVDGGVALNWSIVADDELRGFRIYRQTGGQERLDVLNGSGLLRPDARSFTDKSARAGETYSYTLGVVLADNSELLSPSAEITVGVASLLLGQNHPNPFNPRTTISFTLPEPGHARLSIFSPGGELVRTLVNATLPAGLKEVTWDGKDENGAEVSSGVYFYRLESGKQTLARLMVYLK
ncbi:MAG: hypothetical protein JSW50_08200 [Candidatus Latescibacterota bacterium]|nr:MAG: hypothetical protein JSW50_08200 [Candidatus Latescibacterota bacterium]